MRKPDPVEIALSAVRHVKEAQELAPFLRNRSSAVVSRAAARAADLEGGELTAPLVESFRKLIQDGVKLDKGCQALTNIATALVKRDTAAAEVYISGIRHVQWEPSWGEPVEVAGPLRAMCALGLVRMEYPEALHLVTDLLIDKSPEARIGAIRALAESGRPEAELILRYKARLSDQKAEVTGECFGAILRLGPPARALPFVADFLTGAEDEAAESAALALGESRMAGAFVPLSDAFARHPAPALQAAILWGMALLRQDEAVAFLLQQLQDAQGRIAAMALQSLAVYKGDSAIRQRAEELVKQRGGEPLEKAWLEKAWREHWQ